MLCYGGADDDGGAGDDRLSQKARQVTAGEIVAALALITRDPAFAGFGSKTLW